MYQGGCCHQVKWERGCPCPWTTLHQLLIAISCATSSGLNMASSPEPAVVSTQALALTVTWWCVLPHKFVPRGVPDVVWLLWFSWAEGNSGLCTKSLMRISHCCSLNVYGSMKNAKLMLNASSKCTENSLHSPEKHLLGIWGPQYHRSLSTTVLWRKLIHFARVQFFKSIFFWVLNRKGINMGISSLQWMLMKIYWYLYVIYIAIYNLYKI